MDIVAQLKAVLAELKKESVSFALAGGLATSIYRAQKRTTDDLDFLIFSESETEEVARRILGRMGYKIMEARKANLEGGSTHAVRRRTAPIYILVGRREGAVGLDFVLPNMPWFTNALQRAQSNVIDFQIARIPCLTVEDVILSKFHSLLNDSTRFTDADDLKSVFERKQDIDLAYITGQMKQLGLTVPLSVEKLVPRVLLSTSKLVRKMLAKQAIRPGL